MELKVAAIFFSLIPFLCNGLPTDCNPAEMERMDLKELLEVANISQNCLNAAADVFKSKYAHEQTVEIYDGQQIILNGSELFNGFETVLNTLKYFGHMIEKLDLDESYEKTCNSTDLHQYIEVLRAVNQHCSKTLHELKIDVAYCELDIFSAIIGPFEKVEDVTINFVKGNASLQTHNVKLNEVFPHVKKMFLGIVEVTDAEFADHVYPELKHFGAHKFLFKNDTEPIFEEIIKKNPQIKALSFREPTRKALKHANELLPDLEKLELWSVIENTDTDEIHFKNVREFNSGDVLKNITFEDLREIDLDGEMDNETSEFLIKNQNLQKLTIEIDLNDSDVQRFIGKFKQLSEANLEFDESVSAETVVQFVKASEKLNKLSFSLNVDNVAFKRELESQLAADFNLSISTYYIVIVRKIPV